jgi:FkbM family methyltransferase
MKLMHKVRDLSIRIKLIRKANLITRLLNILREFTFLIIEYPFYYIKEIFNIVKSIGLNIAMGFETTNLIRKCNGVYFNYNLEMDPSIRRKYLGLNQKNVIKVILNNLKKGEVFIDIGANIGTMSLVGVGLVGKKGEVHCFEPVPSYFMKLLEFKLLNQKYQIFPNNFALGENPSTTEIKCSNYNIGWNTIVPKFLNNPEIIKEKIEVKIKRLDDYIFMNNLDEKNIGLIKIDVEGYEYPVLKGMSRFFNKVKKLPPILVEIAAGSYPIMDSTLKDFQNYMIEYGYKAFSLDKEHNIDIYKLKHTTNVLFLNSN